MDVLTRNSRRRTDVHKSQSLGRMIFRAAIIGVLVLGWSVFSPSRAIGSHKGQQHTAKSGPNRRESDARSQARPSRYSWTGIRRVATKKR
jgi:hypothetical protein